MAEGIPLAGLRLDARDESDLRWLFGDSEAAMGLRSSMGAMIDRLNLGTTANRGSVPMGCSSDAIEQAHARVAAVERARRVTGRLKQLLRCHQRTLEAFYGDTLPRYQAAKLTALGPMAALALLTADRSDVGRRAVYEACGEPKGADGAKARVLLAGLRRDAEAALTRACRAYKGTTS